LGGKPPRRRISYWSAEGIARSARGHQGHSWRRPLSSPGYGQIGRPAEPYVIHRRASCACPPRPPSGWVRSPRSRQLESELHRPGCPGPFRPGACRDRQDRCTVIIANERTGSADPVADSVRSVQHQLTVLPLGQHNSVSLHDPLPESCLHRPGSCT
jgi:hypothetical protein